MTTLYSLGSGSRGNCFAVETDGSVLLVDVGFSAREIGRRAERAGLGLDQVVGIALTHEHGDHACGAARLARTLGVPVLTAPGTWERICAAMEGAEHRTLGLTSPAVAGPFRVRACPTSHDAAEPLAVVIDAPDGTTIGVAYDLGRPTAALRYMLRGLTAVVLEANYDDVLLRTSGYPPSVQHRIAGAGGHLSNRAAADLLTEIHHEGLGTVVLAHLSQRCNEAAAARATVEPALRRAGFRGELHVALQADPLPPMRVASPRRVQMTLQL
ncbi:MAG: MBL fold metallo-hydrolase [Gemmatimonadales bacterium]|nr:MBL fold metallo-hydrolase [Gemmatimonadales bacterium]